MREDGRDRPEVPGSEWQDAGHVNRYLAETMPNAPAVASAHEDVLRELITSDVRSVLDLGCGDGRLMAITLELSPEATAVGLDFSEPMLELARARFAGNDCVTLVAHDLSEPLPDLGTFDLVISGYAIHHLEDARKIALYREAFACTSPGGRFVNVEHVASPTEPLHQGFMAALGIATEDPSNRCVSVQTQLSWLREVGFDDVDCLWKWREMALLAARRLSAS